MAMYYKDMEDLPRSCSSHFIK